MTSTRRILINFIATYGRSLFALACGIFSSRWLLLSLGELDYGLYGLVGGLTAFVSFFNNLLSTSVGRYYAFAVGAAERQGEQGLRVCREWFNTALLIHTVIPILLMVIGYPFVEYFVRHGLEIPPDRLNACLWVLRFTCISCFVGMISVPFNAMYLAKQYIAELTIYSFVTTTLNVCVLYYMLTHPKDWLASYAAITALLAVAPQVIITLRAIKIFPECRIVFSYLWQPQKIKELFIFSAYRFAGSLTIMIQSQGMAILVNNFLGAHRNAAMTLGNTLSSQAETLAGALFGALSPAITNAAGANNLQLMRSLALRACKFGTLFVLIFALPMMLEVETLFNLWLKTPPAMAADLCLFCLVILILEKITSGHFMAIFAIGKIAGYQLGIGICGLIALPLAWGLLASTTWDLWAVGWALLIAKACAVLVRLYSARKWAQMSIRIWTFKICLPLIIVSALSLAGGAIVTTYLPANFLRIFLTTACVEILFLPLVWFVVLDTSERVFVLTSLKKTFASIGERLKKEEK